MKDIHEVLRQKQTKYAQLGKQIEMLQQAAEKLREVAPLLAENDDEDGEGQGDKESGAEGHGGFDRFLNGVAEEGFQTILEALCFLGQSAGDVASSFLPEETEGKMQDMVVEVMANVANGEDGGFF